MAEKYLGSRVSGPDFEYRGIFRIRTCFRRVDAPTGQDAGQGDHVLLRVHAIGAERVQFDDLAREILVEAGPIAAGAGAAWGSAERVVEVDQHRRVLRCGEQQVTETAERKGTDRLLLIVADPHIIQPLAGEHIEMVEPEIDHDLLQLASAQYRSENSCFGSIPENDPHTLLLGLLQLGRGLEAAQGAQRSVELPELNRVQL